MTPEEHANWHLRQNAKTLEKNLRTIGDYIYDRSLWLIFENRPRDRLVPYNERPVDTYRFKPEVTDVMKKSLLSYYYNAVQIQGKLPAGWKLPKLDWEAPKGVREAESMSAKFNAAADGLKEKIKTLPFDPGWRGVGQRIARVFGY